MREINEIRKVKNLKLRRSVQSKDPFTLQSILPFGHPTALSRFYLLALQKIPAGVYALQSCPPSPSCFSRKDTDALDGP